MKICSFKRGAVWVPGARQSQNDVAKTSNIILIQLTMIKFLSITTNNIYAFHVSVLSFVIIFGNQYQYVVIPLPGSILLIFSAVS